MQLESRVTQLLEKDKEKIACQTGKIRRFPRGARAVIGPLNDRAEAAQQSAAAEALVLAVEIEAGGGGKSAHGERGRRGGRRWGCCCGCDYR